MNDLGGGDEGRAGGRGEEDGDMAAGIFSGGGTDEEVMDEDEE